MSNKTTKTGLSDSDRIARELAAFLEETKFNGAILVPLIRHLILVDQGTGYHTIEIVVRDHNVATIKGADTELVNLSIKL